MGNIERKTVSENAQILDAFFAAKVLQKIPAYLASGNAEQKACAAAKAAASSELVDIQAEISRLTADQGSLQNALALLDRWAREEARGAREARELATKAIVDNALAGKKSAGPINTDAIAAAECRRSIVMDAIRNVGVRLEATHRELRRKRIEEFRVLAAEHSTMADLITAIVVEESAGAIALEGSVTLDPRAGRSGALRARAAELYRQYEAQLRDFEDTQRQNAAASNN